MSETGKRKAHTTRFQQINPDSHFFEGCALRIPVQMDHRFRSMIASYLASRMLA